MHVHISRFQSFDMKESADSVMLSIFRIYVCIYRHVCVCTYLEISRVKESADFLILSIFRICIFISQYVYVQLIADSVAQNPKIISKTFLTNQKSAHGIYD